MDPQRRPAWSTLFIPECAVAAHSRPTSDRMSTLAEKIGKADRLNVIAERIGFALWQLQELEGAAAQYYVLIEKASPGMGIEAGQELLDEALSKTFGKTVTRLLKSGQVPTESMKRFQALLNERNWLVHNSRATSTSAVHDELACIRLIERIDAIADEALNLLREVSKLAETFILSKGFSQQHINAAVHQAHKQVLSRSAI